MGDKTVVRGRKFKSDVTRTRTLERAGEYFNCTDSQRAVFEAGIKLGTVYHQFIGTPVSIANVDVLESAIEATVTVQPFVRSVKVSIDRERLTPAADTFDYLSLTGDMLSVDLVVEYESVRVACRMEYIPELRYPLMYVSSVDGDGPPGEGAGKGEAGG